MLKSKGLKVSGKKADLIARLEGSSSSTALGAFTRGLLFDCDGVIIETESIHLQAYNEAWKRNGLVNPVTNEPVFWSVEYYDMLQVGFVHRVTVASSFQPTNAILSTNATLSTNARRRIRLAGESTSSATFMMKHQMAFGLTPTTATPLQPPMRRSRRCSKSSRPRRLCYTKSS